MRRQSARMLSMILVILFTFTSIQFMPAYATEGRTAKIYDFTNTVTVTRGKSSIKVYKGMRLKEGDTIKTGEKSIAYIEIDNDKLVKMDASTIITISNLNGTDKNGNINISLSAGKIYNDIKKKLTKNSTYKVRTPNAVMGVRGTTFVVDLEPSGDNSNVTNLTVLDGTVAFATSKQEDTNVYVEMNHKASTSELSKENLPIIKKVNTQDLGTFELEEVVKDTELKENISEILKQENTTLDDVIKQAEKREIEIEKQANEDRLKESSNSETNDNISNNGNSSGNSNSGNGNSSNTPSNNGNGNPNANPNNNGNGNGNGNSSNVPGNNGNGNPNANSNNNGNGNGNSSNETGNNGNGNPNANPNNNGNGNGNSSNVSGNNGNGNPNANPNNNGNGNGNSSNVSGNNGNGNPNANPNNNGNGNGKGNGKGNGNSGNGSGNNGNGNPNANPNNNGNGNGNSGNGSGNNGNGNPNANPNNNGNGNGIGNGNGNGNGNPSNVISNNGNGNINWYPPFWGPIFIPEYNWGW